MTGARAALPAWTDFMIAATRGRPVEDFPMPAGTVTREVCAETGMLATQACPNITTEQYPEGSEPTEYCTQHPGPPLQPSPPEGTIKTAGVVVSPPLRPDPSRDREAHTAR
jgi:membrane carboxypeptidase/penicillin-binding protein